MKFIGGTTNWLEVPRYKCSNKHPKRYHTGLPEELSFHRHYATDLIQDAADGLLTSEDLEKQQTNYPSDQTLERWKEWVDRNILNMDGHLKSIGSRIPGFGDELLNTAGSLLEKLRFDGEPWLAIVQRIIYNSGGFLPR